MTNRTIASSAEIIWNKLGGLVTSSSLDFISSCSPEVCGQKKQGISLRMHLAWHESSKNRPESRKHLFISLFLNETSHMFVPPTPILSRRWHYQYRLYCFRWKKKNRSVFNCNSSAIIYNSMFMLIFCLRCVGWERKHRERWCLHIHNILSPAPRFSERILTMSNKGHRFNCPVWPGQPHPPTRTPTELAHINVISAMKKVEFSRILTKQKSVV